MVFAIHWHESAMDLHVFPIPIPPPTSLSTRSLWVFRGRRRGWDVVREQHRNMYIIKGETDHQPRLDPWDKCSGLVHRPLLLFLLSKWVSAKGMSSLHLFFLSSTSCLAWMRAISIMTIPHSLIAGIFPYQPTVNWKSLIHHLPRPCKRQHLPQQLF